MAHCLLIVDDEPAILLAFQKLLTGPMVTVDTAETPQKAQELLEERSYTTIIADLRFSGFASEEGLELLRYAKTLYPKIHTILMTAYGNKEIREKAQGLGVDYYLEKPISIGVLRKALHSLGIGEGENEAKTRRAINRT